MKRYFHQLVVIGFVVTQLLVGIPLAQADSLPTRTISGMLYEPGVGFALNAGGATIVFTGAGITATGTFSQNQYGQEVFAAHGPAGVYTHVKLASYFGVMDLDNSINIDASSTDVQTNLGMNMGLKFDVQVIDADGNPVPNIPVVFEPTGNGQTLLGDSATATASNIQSIDNYPTSALPYSHLTNAQGYAETVPALAGLEYYHACAFFANNQVLCSPGSDTFVYNGGSLVIQNPSLHSPAATAPVLSAASPTNTAPVLHWTASSTSVYAYSIYRNGSLLATVPASQLSFTDNNPTTYNPSDPYSYYGATNTYQIVPLGQGTNLASNTVQVIYDTLGPRIVPTGYSSAWTNQNVAIGFSCTDNLSGVASCPDPIVFSDEGADQSRTVYGYDNAGNLGSLTTYGINIDRTAPRISYTLSQAPNANGWNKNDVTVTFTCADALSGVASCPAPITVSQDTSGTTISGTATDNAGNSASTSVVVKLDKTPPTISNLKTSSVITTLVTPNINLTATVGDALSGVTGAEYYFDTDPGQSHGTSLTVNGSTISATISPSNLSLGIHTLYVRSVDAAGNWSQPVRTTFIFANPKLK